MAEHRQRVAMHVRRLVAEVYGWSFGGTKETTRINYHLTGRHELGQRISDELGVVIPEIEWPHLVTVGKLAEFVDMEIQREYASGE
jgi:hypothetical protein